MPRYDITAIGEGGLRLSVPSGTRLERADQLDVAIAGTEANVLASMASLGWRAGWASALPDSPLGRRVEHQLRTHGVDLACVRRIAGARVGTYFVEYGAAPRPTQVLFDRANTAFTQLTPDDLDWDAVLDTRVLHLTGLTAALSTSVLDVLHHALRLANQLGVPVSFDVNYRSTLWSVEDAAKTLSPFLEGADVLFCRSEDARAVFGLDPEPEYCLQALREMTNARHVLVSCSERGVLASVDGTVTHAKALPVEIVDRLGAGDGLAAGFLHGLLAGDLGRAPEFATAMAALALAQRGEQITTTAEEIDSILANPATRLNR